MNMKKTGELIAQKRTELGITQAELAEKLNVSDKAVSKWERGLSCPDVTLFVPLTNILHITVDELINGQLKASGVSCYKQEDAKTETDISDYSASEILDSKSDSLGFVSPLIFGENLEHTRSDVFHGISAQMLNNRKFAGKPERYHGCKLLWYPVGTDVYFMEDGAYTRHCKNYHMRRSLECYSQTIVNCANGVPAGIGQHEIPYTAGKEYEFRVVVKSASKFDLTVALTSRHGKKVYCEHKFNVDAPDWTTYTCILKPDSTDSDGDIRVYFSDDISVTLGALSLMPADNFRGLRKDVIAKLKEMGVTILRWPGGNFAGEYCWEDGLMPCDMRAPFESYMHLETQPHSLGYDFHEMNIDDFVMLCREIGAEPFITINPVWSTPEEDGHFVEYCNGDENTEYGKIRIERGFKEPFNVKFWSLGNEMGYGHMEGDNTPSGYCKIAKTNADAMLAIDPDLTLCSCGPYNAMQTDWINYSVNPLSDRVPLCSVHHYSGSPTYRDKNNLKKEYYDSLNDVETIRKKLYGIHKLLSDKVKISFDEWNNWYAWYHQSYIYNGIYSALVLTMLIEEAERCGLGLVCHFEAVNEGMIEVFENDSKLTAAGQIFSVMSKHKCGEIVYSSRFAVVTRHNDDYVATLVNASFDENKKFTLPKYAKNSDCKLYYGDKIKPNSYFEEKEYKLTETADGFEAVVPPHSVLLVKFSD